MENLQNDIWETMLTALCLGTIIAGASVFRISGFEKESAEYQKASYQAEERLRHLSQQLVSSQEQERKALSRELHDEIGQLLTALRMELGSLERSQVASRARKWTRICDQAKKLAETRSKPRAISPWVCGPPCSTCWGWGRRWSGRRASIRGAIRLPFNWTWTGIYADLPDPHRTYLYRIVQEGLTNCARHAQAKNIR